MANTLAQETIYRNQTDSVEPHEYQAITSQSSPIGPGGSAKRQDGASISDLIHRPSPANITSEISSLRSEPRFRRQRTMQTMRKTANPPSWAHRNALLRDSQVAHVEENRVFCRHCRTWIELPKDYCPIAWEAHKRLCNKPNRPRQRPGPKPRKRESTIASGATPETSPAYIQLRRTEEERINFLLSDPHATTVEAHRILCAICRRWIQLRKNSTYCTAPWVQHVRKCAARHNTPRLARSPSGVADAAEQDDEDDSESFEEISQDEVIHEDVPAKRGRGRPRKRKSGHAKELQPGSFALRPVSDAPLASPSSVAREAGHRSVSPLRLRTPSPLPSHPYSTDLYWFPTVPPMSSYYSMYAGSQYNESDDSYSLYFHARPPAHQPGALTAQSRSRARPSRAKNPTKTPGSGGTWPGNPPKFLQSGSTQDSQLSSGPDSSAGQAGRAWIVWRLKNYSTNSCPMDPSPAPESQSTLVQRASSEVSGSSSEPRPLYRSGTWSHLLDPQGPSHARNLSPYVPPETVINGQDTPSAQGTHSAQFGQPSKMVSPSPDPGLVSFNSSAHIPIRKSDTYPPPPPRSPPPPPPQPPRSPLPPQPVPPPPKAMAPDASHDHRLSAASRSVLSRMPPDPPKGIDLDSPECRLSYTFQSIAYLFSTSYQGADDMSLDTLTAFMNHCMPREKMYDGQEVSAHVAVLGERKQLIFTKEGGVQLLSSPP